MRINTPHLHRGKMKRWEYRGSKGEKRSNQTVFFMDKRVSQTILLDKKKSSQDEAYHNKTGHLDRGGGNCRIMKFVRKLHEGHIKVMKMTWEEKEKKNWVYLRKETVNRLVTMVGEIFVVTGGLCFFLMARLTLFPCTGIFAHPYSTENKRTKRNRKTKNKTHTQQCEIN